jgi:RNA polymerase sigma-70 factor (ECF subfamily)
VPRPLPIQPSLSVVDALTVTRVYRAHAKDVARWAARLGGPRVDAEEIVQDVFAVVSRKLRQFRGDAKLETWLFRITDKIVRNQRRRAAVRRVVVGWSDDLSETMASEEPDAHALLEAKQRAARAYEVLDRLSDKHRRVLILFELEDMSSDDIGVLLGTKASTVRVWLFRAREKFLECQRKLEGIETP